MANLYHIIYEKNTHKDFKKIKKFSTSKIYYRRIIEEITSNIENLKYMPRIHKTLICFKDPKGEYRRNRCSPFNSSAL